MKKIKFIVMMLVTLFTLSSCIFSYDDLFEKTQKKLNQGEVGNQEIWLSNWKVSACSYSGTTKVVEFEQNEEILTSACCSHELYGNKNYSIYVYKRDSLNNYNFYSSMTLNLEPHNGDRHVSFVPYEKCTWKGEKQFSYKVEIRNLNHEIVKEAILEYTAVGK